MQITSPNRGRLLKIYLLLLLLSGLISCALIFLEPSEHGSAILGGYSPSRLSMGFLLITGLVLLGWFAYRVMRYPAVTARFIARIDPFVVHNHHLAHLILGLVLLALLLLGWMFYVPSAYASHLVLLQGVDHRTKPV